MRLELAPDLDQALHALVYERFGKPAGMSGICFRIEIHPDLPNELEVDVDYSTSRFILRTPYVPTGGARFFEVIEGFFKELYPRFYLEQGKLHYRQTVVKQKGALPKKRKGVKITPLVGLRIEKDGSTIDFVESGTNLFDLQERILRKLGISD